LFYRRNILIKIPDDIVRWMPNLELEELKLFLVISRYTSTGEDIPFHKIPTITGFEDPDDINRGIKGLIDKELISLETTSGDKIYWLDTELARAKDKHFFSKIKPLYFQQSKEIQKANGPIAFDLIVKNLMNKAHSKIKRDPEESSIKFLKKSTKKNVLYKYYYYYIYIFKPNEDYTFMFGNENHITKHKSRAAAREESFTLFSFLYTSIDKENYDSPKENENISNEGSRRNPHYFISFYKTLDKKIRKNKAKILVSHFTDHLYSLSDGKLSLKKKWSTKQNSIMGRLLKDYPEIDFNEWKEIIDFFMEDDFWQDKITNLLQIENHLQKYQIKKSKKKKSKRKKRKNPTVIK